MLNLDKRVLLVLAVLMMLVIIPTSFAADDADAGAVGVDDVSVVDAVDESAIDTVDVSEKTPNVLMDDSYTYVTTPNETTVTYLKGDTKNIRIDVDADEEAAGYLDMYDTNVCFYVDGAKKATVSGASLSQSFTINLGTYNYYLSLGSHSVEVGPDKNMMDNLGYTYNYVPIALTVVDSLPETYDYETSVSPSSVDYELGTSYNVTVTAECGDFGDLEEGDAHWKVYINDDTDGIVIDDVDATVKSFTFDLETISAELEVGENTLLFHPNQGTLEGYCYFDTFNYNPLTVNVAEPPAGYDYETSVSPSSVDYVKGTSSIVTVTAECLDFGDLEEDVTTWKVYINGDTNGIATDVDAMVKTFTFDLATISDNLVVGENIIVFHPNQGTLENWCYFDTFNYNPLNVTVSEPVVGDYAWIIQGKTGGYDTLAAAVEAAESGDAIIGSAGIDETVSSISIAKDLTISAPNLGDVVLKANSTSKNVFNLSSGKTLTLNNIEFKDYAITVTPTYSNPVKGGAIYSNGNLYVNNCSFENITIPSNSNSLAPAIYNDGGSLYVDSCIFDTLKGYYGAAIYNYGSYSTRVYGSVRNTEFRNSVTSATASQYYAYYSDNDIVNCTFENEDSSYCAVYSSYSFLNISDSTFRNLSSKNYAAGIYATTSSNKLNVYNCIFENLTLSGSTNNIAAAINMGTANSTISKSTFIACNAAYTGTSNYNTAGAVSVKGGELTNNIFLNNAASGKVTYNDLVATAALTADSNYWGTNEGPVANVSYNSNYVTVNNWAIITAAFPEPAIAGVTDDIVFNLNTYTTSEGATGSIQGDMPNIDLDLTYALNSENPSSVSIENGVGTISYTPAQGGKENITDQFGNIYSFEILADASSIIYVDDAAGTAAGPGTSENPYKTIAQALNSVTAAGKTIVIRSGTYTEKDLEITKDMTIQADKNAEVVIDANKQGRIFIVNNAVLTLRDLTLINGLPDYSADSTDYDGKGGAILVDYGSLIANNINVYNSTSATGGAIASIAGPTGILNITGSSFIDNNIDDDPYLAWGTVTEVLGGGAIYSNCNNLIIDDCTFTNNKADDGDEYDHAKGGAIYIASPATIMSSTFTVNHANGDAGAIQIDAGNTYAVNISSNTFNSNEAEYNGGAISAALAGSVLIDDNEFNSNEAYYGGAIYTANNNMAYVISNNGFDANSATAGGTIYIRYGAVTLSQNTIGTSTASSGKKIYMAGGSVNSVVSFLGNATVNAELGSTINLTATVTDDMGNDIRGGSISFTVDGADYQTVPISTQEPQTTFTVPADASGDILISGSFSLARDGTVKTGTIHPTVLNWFIEGGNGYETLAEAVEAANANDIIYGNPGTYTVNGIIIAKNITIKANEAGSIILDGNASKIFTVRSSANFNLVNLTLTNGGSSGGGFVGLTTGNLYLINSTLKDLSSTTEGGAITVASGCNLTVEGSVFENINSSGKAPAITASAASSVVTIKDSAFNNINCTRDYSVMQIQGNLTIERSNFTNIGGQYRNNYYGVVGAKSNLWISECQFINITGGDGASVYYEGSGILNITKSLFINNNVFKGAICTSSSPSSAYIQYNIFMNNAANDTANAKDVYLKTGGINLDANYNFWGTNDQPTSAEINYPSNATKWTVLTLTSEKTIIAPGETLPIIVDFTKYTDGSANYTLADKMPDFTFDLAATLGTIDSPVATANGQASANYAAPSDVTEDTQVTITASPSGASLVLNIDVPSISWFIEGKGSYNTLAEAVEAAVDGDVISGLPGIYDVSNIAIAKNITIKANESDEIVLHVADARFASVTCDVTLNLENLIIENGIASSGGILNINGATVNIDKCTFRDTSISAYSGTYINAINATDAKLKIENSKFDNMNVSSSSMSSYVGAIYALRSDVEITNTNFTNIKAPATVNGAPLFVSGSTLTVKDSEFSNCQGATGAVYAYGGNSLIENTRFIANIATGTGSGGITGATGSNITVNKSIFKDLISNGNGGAIQSAGNKLAVEQSVFMNNRLNKTSNNGGAIYTTANSTINYNIFINNSDNRPTHQGNDVYTSSSTKVINADYNYFGSNDKPDNTSINSKVQLNNWVVLDLSIDKNPEVGKVAAITADMTTYTDGENNGTVAKFLPEIEFAVSAENGTVEPDAIVISPDTEGKATINYTGSVVGTDLVVLKLLDEEAANLPLNIVDGPIETSLTAVVNGTVIEANLTSLGVGISGKTIKATLDNGTVLTGVTNEDGTAIIDLSELAPGDYSITVSFEDEEGIFANATADEPISYSVDTYDTTLYVNDTTVTVGSGTLVVRLISNGAGVAGKTIVVTLDKLLMGQGAFAVWENMTDADGIAIFDLSGLAAGNYKANVTYTDGEVYKSADKEISIEVDKKQAYVEVEIRQDNIVVFVGEDDLAGIEDVDVAIYLNDEEGTILTGTTGENGEAVISIADVPNGSYPATIKVIDSEYGAPDISAYVIIDKESEVEAVGYIISLSLAENGTSVEVFITDLNGTLVTEDEVVVYLSEDDEGTIVPIDEEGDGVFDFDNTLNQSMIFVFTDEEGNEWSSCFEYVVNSTEVPVPVIADVNIELSVVEGSVVAYVTDLEGTPLADKQLYITINDEPFDEEESVTDDEGYWSAYLFGDSTVVVSCIDEEGNAAEASLVYVAGGEPIPIGVKITLVLAENGTSMEVYAYCNDEEFAPTELVYYINDDDGTVLPLNEDGEGVFDIDTSQNQSIEVSYTLVIDEETEFTWSAYYDYVVDIEEIPVPVVANANMSVETTDDAIEATLVDSDGKAINNATITAVIDGEEQNFTTDADGKVSIPVAENATVELSYTDPENGAVIKYSTKVVTKEVEVPVIVPVDVPVVANGTLTVETTDDAIVATLVDSDGKPIANATIIAVVDGEEMEIPTDEDGKCSVLITGNNTVEFTYTDPANNATVSYSTKVVTEVEEVIVPVPVVANATISLSTEDGSSIVATLKDLDGNAIANATLNAKVNGVEQNLTTDANGIATIPVSANTTAEVSYTDSNKATVTSSMSLTVIETIVEINKTIEVPPVRNASQIVCEDMNTIAVAKDDGRIGEYFYVKLVDANGNPLVNKSVQIGFNGKVYNRTTNETGEVKLQINLAYKGTYTFAIAYLGDDNYNGSFVVSKITVKQQTPKLTTASKTYKASAKTKALTATFKTANGNVIADKTIKFTVNGKTYSAKTNAKGIATVNVSLNTKGTYSFTAKYAGDDTFKATSASGKLTLK